ncbi:hypothetical protein PFISCL1PPCAC_25447, partial [Pristionchus fissidentatus]
FTECTETNINGGHSIAISESMAARTPPSTPCRPDLNGNGRENGHGKGMCSEKSPLIKSEKNGTAIRTPISQYKLDDGESIMI